MPVLEERRATWGVENRFLRRAGTGHLQFARGISFGLRRHRDAVCFLSQTGEVENQIGHTDFGTGADHADGPHNQVEAAFLGGEGMLDARSYPGAGGMAAGEVCWHLASSRLLALKRRFQPRRSSVRPAPVIRDTARSSWYRGLH